MIPEFRATMPSSFIRAYLIVALASLTTEKLLLIFSPWTYPECKSGCPFQELLFSTIIDPVGSAAAVVLATIFYLVLTLLRRRMNASILVFVGILSGAASMCLYPLNTFTL